MIIGVPIPNNVMFPKEFIFSLLRLKGKYEVYFEEGPNVANNRNQLFERARLLNEDLLMIDSDAVFTLSNVTKMEELLKKHDIVGGVCMTGHLPYYPAVYTKIMSNSGLVFRPTDIRPDLFEVNAIGAAFLGFSKKVMETLVQPFEIVKDGWEHEYGHDISFCITAAKNGFKVMCEPSIKIGHIRSQVIEVNG